MTSGTRWSRWATLPVAAAAAVLAAVTLGAHAWQAITGAHLNLVSGIWLALGRDLSAGVFYRDLAGGTGYGGTRYFPLFFAVIASFLRAGLSPLAAGWMASAISIAVLISGIYAVVRAIGVPRTPAILWTAAAVTPYFVQQTAFEIRSDVLAAGLNLLGLAAAVRLWRRPDHSAVSVASAVVWFSLAFATKITSLAVPASLVFAFMLSGRLKTGLRLAVASVAGAVIVVAGIDLVSAHRAIASWRACMFAGLGGEGTLASMFRGGFLQLVGYSHFLIALLVLDLVALSLMVAFERRQPVEDGEPGTTWLAALLFLGVSASTAFTLSSPGTITSNQMVEWIQVSFVVFAMVARRREELRRVVCAGVALLVVWAAVQDGIQIRALLRTQPDRAAVADLREQVVSMIATSNRPVLCENPLWPVLAGQRPYVLDPFALRVVLLSRPEIARDVSAKLSARFFDRVVLEMDPTSVRGRGHYENVHFGWPMVQRVLANYRLERNPAPGVWIYVSRDGGPNGPATARNPSL